MTDKGKMVLTFAGLGIAGIALSELLTRYSVGSRLSAKISAPEFASAYLAKLKLASAGDTEAQTWIAAAQRRLSTLRDEAALGNTDASCFLTELRRHKGISLP